MSGKPTPLDRAALNELAVAYMQDVDTDEDRENFWYLATGVRMLDAESTKLALECVRLRAGLRDALEIASQLYWHDIADENAKAKIAELRKLVE